MEDILSLLNLFIFYGKVFLLLILLFFQQNLIFDL